MLHNNAFIETREITFFEYYIILILEDMASHGINGYFAGYSIEYIYLGKRGIYRVLCNENDKLLIGKRYPPRVRETKNKS